MKLQIQRQTPLSPEMTLAHTCHALGMSQAHRSTLPTLQNHPQLVGREGFLRTKGTEAERGQSSGFLAAPSAFPTPATPAPPGAGQRPGLRPPHSGLGARLHLLTSSLSQAQRLRPPLCPLLPHVPGGRKVIAFLCAACFLSSSPEMAPGGRDQPVSGPLSPQHLLQAWCTVGAW